MPEAYIFRRLFVGFGCLLLGVMPLAARQAPAFGDSIKWAGGKEAPSLEAMRGKSVLIIFFQSWCGICNGWSPGLFQQLGETYGDDPKVILVALKTDGGSLKDAVGYLRERTNPDKWLVGVDENAAYYLQASGQKGLYFHMWVTPDGRIGECKGASHHRAGSDPKEYVLANQRHQKTYWEGAHAMFGEGESLSESMGTAVEFAERGMYLTALAEAAKAARKGAGKDEVASFKKKILKSVTLAVERNKKVVEDENAKDRFPAYLTLCRLQEDYGRSAPGQAAGEVVKKHSSAAWLSNEEEAHDDYRSAMRRLARADDDKDRARVRKSLDKIGLKYPDTYYGRMAVGK